MLKRLTALMAVAAALTVAPVAQGHFVPGMHNQMHAVVWGFCSGHDSLVHPCEAGREALVVARLESAWYWDEGRCWEATNGQYHGCLQMGSGERRKYGDFPDPWRQARAAYNYWVDTYRTWSPWSCKPQGYCLH